jgi:hypothetical protein
VGQIQYKDTTGTIQTVSSATYSVSFQDPGRVAPNFGKFWPVTQWAIDAVQVTFTAGYGPVTTVATAISTGAQTVTPASMAGIYAGTVLTFDPGLGSREQVVVSTVTSSTFTATFANSHLAGSAINCVPEDVRTALLMMVAHWYENRQAVIVGTIASKLPLAYDTLRWGNWNGEYS